MTDVASALHGWGHEDYDVAKEHIHRQLGNLDGLRVYGRQALVAVYVRPAFNARTGMHHTEKEQQKDWYEGKVVLLLKTGPSAFVGDDSYMQATFSDGRPPKIGDWMFQNANSGIQISFQGDGHERVMYEDRRGDEHPLYPGEGWQVRMTLDDGFLGDLQRPTSVV